MYLIRGCGVFLLIWMTLAQDINKQEEILEEEKDVRIYNEGSRAIETFPLSDTSRWIPRFQTSEDEDQPLKRRRIRKRKRRPPVFDEELLTRRTMRPQRLDEIKEPWEDMSDEINQKSNNRRRLTPIYGESEKNTENKQFEKVRDPFTALQEAEQKQKKKIDDSTHDLKTILKQSGGLSLSELLQQKNLTLAELLQGNRQAISVLVREAEQTTEIPTSTEIVKYRRLPPSIGLKKDNNMNDAQDTSDGLSSQEIFEAQRKRLSLLHSHRETNMFRDVVKVDVVTEETTEKRIFVPSNSVVDKKLEVKNTEISTEQIVVTTKAPKAYTAARTAKLPITSAKMNKIIFQQHEVPKVTEKTVPVNFIEILSSNVTNKKNKTMTTDGPLKMILELAEVTTTETADLENFIQTTLASIKKIQVEDTVEPTREKLTHVTAADEIMEILKNPQEKENLSKILRGRNMTIEELVKQRERGSSQLHLADIFHNKTREPEPKDEPFIGHIESNDFYNIIFSSNRTAKTIKTNLETPLKKEITTKIPYTITSFPTYKIETNKENNPPPFLPIWHQLYPHFFENDHEGNHIEQSRIVQSTASTRKLDFRKLEEAENALAAAANSQLKTGRPQNIYDDEEFISLPSGVKSAILASLAIIGLSLLVFLTILFIFKWSQKQRRLTYSGSVPGSKIMSPILELNQRRNFRTFVSETLGKRKNYYKAHLQSMSDSIWDKDERKSYMI